MKKANRQRDKILRRNRERLRLHRKAKPDHEPHSWKQMGEDRPGFNIFAWFSKRLPRLRRDVDERDRHRIAQMRGDR